MKKDFLSALFGMFFLGLFVGIAIVCAGQEKWVATAVALIGVIGYLLMLYPAIVTAIKWLRSKGEV